MRHVRVAIGLGSNLGDREGNVLAAANRLADGILEDVRCSSLLANPAVGCGPGAPDFVNAALVGYTPLTARQLLDRCRDVEVAMGRPRRRVKGAVDEDRVIDVDLLLYADAVIDDADLQIPHPRLTQRRFVLEPLAEVAPDWVVPGTGRTVAEHLAARH